MQYIFRLSAGRRWNCASATPHTHRNAEPVIILGFWPLIGWFPSLVQLAAAGTFNPILYGQGPVRSCLLFFAFYSKYQATVTWKFLTSQNFLLRMPLQKQILPIFSFAPYKGTFWTPSSIQWLVKTFCLNQKSSYVH